MSKESLRTDEEIQEVLQLYGNRIYRIAFSRTKNKQDAEDIVQEVFIKYMTTDIIFFEEEHRKAWLFRVAMNASISLMRSAWFKHTAPLEDNLVTELKEESCIYEEVLKLPEKYRILIHLFYYEDMSVKEIAEVLKKSENAVKTGLHRARKKLKITIEDSESKGKEQTYVS